MSSFVRSQIFNLQDVLGKGKGLVATEMIPKGTRILCEEPVVVGLNTGLNTEQLQTSIFEQVATLSEQQQQAFLSLANTYPYKNTAEQYIGIFRTNSLPTKAFEGESAIFLEACRINHACDNNAQESWNPEIKRHTVHALKDIDKGEEITRTYMSPLKNRAARQKVLQEKFGFTCLCHLCSLPEDQSQESDKRLEKIHDLRQAANQLSLKGIVSTQLRTLGYFDQQVRLYEEQGREGVGSANALAGAADLAISNGDLARGRIFAERAASLWKVALGSDSRQAIKYENLAQEPSKDYLYGFSMSWKTKVDETPQGLESSDFEDWLWRREKPKQPGQPIDFRNRSTFPSFNGLPDENDIDPEFYASIDGFTYQPRRHWLFLAEIFEFGTIIRLQMNIRDVDGMKVPLFFYTEGRGRELNPLLIQKGYTVAILYAQFHAFASCEPGIRLEEPTSIKVFPLSLNELLALSDRVQKFSTETSGKGVCHGCNKQATSLKKCAKCSLFWYCDRACQSVGWKEKGHKADCKLLKDPDLRGLFSLDWDEFEHHLGFPLDITTSGKF